MKVFFTASQRGKKYFKKQYQRIYETIRDTGYDLIEDDIIKVEPEDFYKKLQEKGRKGFEDFYKQEIRRIKSADVNIFECSFHSLSIGFIVQISLNIGKPTIVLYKEDFEPIFLKGIKDERFILVEYRDETLINDVKEALKEAKKIRDKRFNFFISSDLLNYIKQESRKQNTTMSVFIRNLILDHKEKNS